MEEFLNLNNIELSTTSLAQFLIGFIITIILSISLKHIYVKYSNSVSNKKIISNIFPLFGVSIFLIVITIKSSIVLSLGLVGALSIIRFRTAIKEAEQIVYFLIITGIAIATAANSYVYPFVLVIFVFVYNFFMTYNKDTGVHSVNDQLILNVKKITNKQLDQLMEELLNNKINVEVQSINKSNTTIIVLKLSDFRIDTLTVVETFLNNNSISINEIQFFSSTE
jgi:hypothetical protein|tara:strand:+ start:1961 stop:2632 length:672 start_codon:yes stop_codon:yes gene_type:complete